MSSAKKDQITAELEAIRAKNGGILTSRAVVLEARRNKKLKLHSEFDWNVDRAAMKHWLDRAQEIITRFVTVEVVHRNEKVTSVYYVRRQDAHSNEPGYTSIDKLDRRQSTDLIIEEIDRIKANIIRGHNIALYLDSKHPGLHALFESMLEQLAKIEEKLQAAE